MLSGKTVSATNIRIFRKALRKFERIVSTLQKDNSCCVGATFAQCHVLLEIEELGETTIAELAGSLRLDKSTLSRTIDGLVTTGLVERKPNPADRRFTLLSLTKSGKKTCDNFNKANDEYYEQVFRAIPPEEHKEVMHYFGLLVQALEERDQNCSDGSNCYDSCEDNREKKE